ncbi:LTA synthase family protein [Sinanaerobacter sp. ZZT-01]|uniref:LTA synthase family protein n=1 Tax=Sinanaerobacter sp. ZZT-01 TaxID=3111540 RepID=UPI002D77CC21|nr:LTA synthase family protein [Sinanaerobacter sp. ZZT-01]WRR93302.1 LTA synthase family protein [Sinanaerobacter sp. ZZT-01]
MTIWVLALLILTNPIASPLFTSIDNQEFFSYHIRDLLQGLTGGVFGQEKQDYYLATGTYENQIDGPLFGAAKGKNLILIQVEALQNIMINASYNGQELTPNLNQLIKEQGSLYFDHYYQQLGSGNTSDSEFVTNNSYLGSIESYTYQLYEDNYFKGLPWILKEQGYQTAVFHGYNKTFWNRESIYPKLGFDTFINSDVLKNDNIIGIGGGNITGISDAAFFQQSTEILKTMQQPFYSFLITLSSHHPFKLPSELSQITLAEEDKDTLFGDYINSVCYADQCLGMFLDSLKENGLYDNSVIALYGDHFGLPQTDADVQAQVSKFLGYDYKLNHMMNIPLIIHLPNSDVNETLSITAGESDFLPTISYLLGLEHLDTLYLGQNLLTAKSGFVFEQTHLLKGSFINDDIVFEMSRDGVFSHSKAWRLDDGSEVDVSPYETESLRAKKLIELSDFYLKNDVLRKALLQGLNIDEIVNGTVAETEKPEFVYTATAKDIKEDSELDKIVKSGDEVTILVTPSADWQEADASKVFFMDLINYLQENKNLKALMNLDEDAISMLRYLKNDQLDTGDNDAVAARKEVVSRLIPVLHSFDLYTKTEYEGFKDVMVTLKKNSYTIPEVKDFLEQNKPWAVAINVDDANEENLAYVLKRKSEFVYGYGSSAGHDETSLKNIGFDGFIVKPVQAPLPQ